MSEGALLTVSSHVSHGHVGNRAIVFPLQYYGWDVDAIHTTDFSNHPGYGKFRGQKSTSAAVAQVFKGLEGILDLRRHFKMILVGYCPSAEVLATVYDQLLSIMEPTNTPRPVLVVDPVLGDNGRLYVPQDVVETHKRYLKLVPADLTTPNQFELELLSGVQIHGWDSVKRALHEFHALYGVPNVVVSSLIVDGCMYSVGYNCEEKQFFRIAIEQIDCRFSGCGDVFTALLTHAFHKNGYRLSAEVLGQVLHKLHRILRISHESEKARLGRDPEVVHEIRLVESRAAFDDPCGPLAVVQMWGP